MLEVGCQSEWKLLGLQELQTLSRSNFLYAKMQGCIFSDVHANWVRSLVSENMYTADLTAEDNIYGGGTAP